MVPSLHVHKPNSPRPAPSRCNVPDRNNFLILRDGGLKPGFAKKMERKTGFEPATFSLARRRSTTEPLPPVCDGVGRLISNSRPTVLDDSITPFLRAVQTIVNAHFLA